ncbi:phage integrase family protein [Orenia metallireducens]|uniref:Phage integrase family protein n=1 Tax=Orenia metallireducens TaxID=1413210 RepID=A0A285IDH3_9FIRM|nr:site-specific integrase [Orenia metallireducens]PRX19645.1 phage integrase family protein [Orenia metallireducens]SNY45973.1 Phage integrase family protein [Orenia metallireducens]
MNRVEAIKDQDKIEEMKSKLFKSSYRDYLLFVIGINTGLRISDILNLKVSDVKDKDHIIINEDKSGKEKKYLINPQLRKEIDKYIINMKDWQHLFQSQKGHNQPISRVQAYRVLKKAAKELRINDVGTHTLRKTFAYHHYLKNRDLALLQDLFNHSSPSLTLNYIGIDEAVMDKNIIVK